MSKRTLVLIAALAITVLPQASQAAFSCQERSLSPILADAPEAAKCQKTIAKAGEIYLRKNLKTVAGCMKKKGSSAGTCPSSTDLEKIEKLRVKAAGKIAKDCGEASALGALQSPTYATFSETGTLASCMMSQHNVEAKLLLAISNGVTLEEWPGSSKDRGKCAKEVNKWGVKTYDGLAKQARACLAKQSKRGTAGDLSPVCVGSVDAAGNFVLPTDTKTATKMAKVISLAEANIAKKCGPSEASAEIASLMACPGAQTVADLQECIVCSGIDATFNVLEQQFLEDGTYVANGAAPTLQNAVVAAAAGDKLLIGEGTYVEEVVIGLDPSTNPATPIDHTGLALVGCGGASDLRPVISAVADPQPTGRGIRADEVDGLLFQSLDFFDQDNDHIRISNAVGVTFRDIHGNGNRNTAYAVFPIHSDNVVVELSDVRAQDDAPIYVGQSSGIVVRYNDVRDGVAGIEIENSGSAQVYGNYGTGNTAGLMVFKDGRLPVQLSECHEVHHNLFENNNEPNFGSGSVGAVPTGTGMISISADTTPYYYNILRGNDTAGMTITDQKVAGFGPPFSDDPTVGDEQSVDDNFIFNNWMSGNGAAPDTARWPLPLGYDLVFLASETSNNCESGNIFETELGFAAFSAGANSGTCVLPPPDFAPACPTPPLN